MDNVVKNQLIKQGINQDFYRNMYICFKHYEHKETKQGVPSSKQNIYFLLVYT